MTATILHGDCLDLLRSMPSESVDALITDPPYSSGGMMRNDRAERSTTEKYVQTGTSVARRDFSGDNRDQRGYHFWCALWLSECARVLKNGAPVVLFTDWRQLPVTTDVLQAGGFIWRGIAAWDKTEGARPQYGRFRAQCEFAVWGSNGPMRTTGDALPGVFRHSVKQSDKHHITGKPTSLMREIVRICDKGGVILDPFAGSGTTGVAAISLGYQFIGIERDAHYAEVARRRIADASAVQTFDFERQVG